MRALSIVGKESIPMNTCGLLQYRRPDEVLGQDRRFLGRLLGIAVRVGVLCHSGYRPGARGGPRSGWIVEHWKAPR